MDPHKTTRGRLLDSWVEAHGGAVRCLVSAGYEQGSKEFKAREAHLSVSRRTGMGHVAALRYEREFEAQGMQSGYLTNDLDDVDDRLSVHKSGSSDLQKRPSFPSNENAGLSPISVQTAQKRSMIPVNPQPSEVVAFNWEQLMQSILKEGLAPLEAGIWVEVPDDSMSGEFTAGDQVMVQRVQGYIYKAGDKVLVREGGGDLLLREFRAITSKTFEAVPLNAAYGTLHSQAHGLEVLAKVTRVTKVYR
jgi:hypothetical protein